MKQDEVVRITTNLVQVDVVVTNKTGQQVTNLRPEDFEISEDRKQKQIIHFSYIVTDGRPTNKETATPPASSSMTHVPVTPASLSFGQMRRTIAVVVDDLGLSAESIASVKEALRKFVTEQMQANDHVAICSPTVRTNQSLIQPLVAGVITS